MDTFESNHGEINNVSNICIPTTFIVHLLVATIGTLFAV